MNLSFLFLWLSIPVVLAYFFGLYLLGSLGQVVGYYLRRASRVRKELLLARVKSEQRAYAATHSKGALTNGDDDWEEVEGYAAGTAANGAKGREDWKGIMGFFHPFCNAGGGGERVLWAAIRANQKRWPDAVCVVYTGDHDVDKAAILKRVANRFNIHLHPPTVHFLYLSTRRYVLSSTWPHFTLLGQSLGSLILAYDAFSLLVPDIFIDTMGYAFALALSTFLFPAVPTSAYVHYPTISTDMLASLSSDGQGVNAGAGVGWKGFAKRHYWSLFARLYCLVGSTIDVVMTNSTWTQSHIRSLWAPRRARRLRSIKASETDIDVVFPPVAVEELTDGIDVSPESESKRGPTILYIAQFRPEKNHTLIIEAFAKLVAKHNAFPSFPNTPPKLVLVGSVRDSDDATRVYNLRLLAHERKIKEKIEFVCDASWPQILDWLQRASVGVNGMWNEHFGIGVVEYQAAGLISVVNDSGGPKLDIVVDIDGEPTGFHASTVEEYASAFAQALSLSPAETSAMRLRARKSALRFTDRIFAEKWIGNMERLVQLQERRARKS
ncbi:alpha-1,2-mannosyltransferase ALG11 [Lophium mytilinum]|uniref:GDP-Man:Man(3)GlcNAc(2)-PP-Dol alpha-1,2-mannosyltransferase n=1 Tax=Lophium mytilinum TaxID=390894 RepID=A0A6A6QG47_9PEZI|nr:alpha-1,2-mannosyltransferase ALG11 [Lophium mytilinum]